MISEWLEPWYPIDREEERGALLAELQREIDSTHSLRGLAAAAVARRRDNDDVLFALADGRLAVVHLTWRGGQDRSPYPWTNMYSTAEAFVQNRMIPDHRECTEDGAS